MPSPAPEAATHTSPKAVPPSPGAPTGRSPTGAAGPEIVAPSEPAVIGNDQAPSAQAPSIEEDGHKRHRREKSHGGPPKRLKRAASRASKSAPPSQPTAGAAGEGAAAGSAGAPEAVRETPEAAQAVRAGSGQQAPPPPETSSASLISSAGCKEVALQKYNKSILSMDRKRVEEPTISSLQEALVFAGRVSFLNLAYSHIS